MSFRSPLLLLLLLIPAAAVVAYVLAQRRPARHAIAFPNLAVLETVVTRSSQWRRHIPAALLLAALLGLVSLIAPAILSGNAAIVLASESVPLVAITLAEILATAVAH